MSLDDVGWSLVSFNRIFLFHFIFSGRMDISVQSWYVSSSIGGFMVVTDTGPIVEYVVMEDIRVAGQPKLHMRINHSEWYPVECAIENYASCNRALLSNYRKQFES